VTEWWTYRPEDFLLFSPRAYWRMFELHNSQYWPLHLVMLAAGIGMVILVLRQHRDHGFWIALTLAALWIFVGWSFLWNRYMPINWAMAYVAPVFGGEALLLAIAAARGGDILERSDVTARLGLLIAAVGLVAYPLLAPLFGRPWSQAEVFGIAPDPTAIATLGLMLSARGRWPSLLLPIPIAWLMLSGLTLRTMGEPQGVIALGAAGTAVALLGLRLVAR
jgi:hypothetical protein